MVISDRQMGHPHACCSKWATHDAQNRWCPHGKNASRASRSSMRQTSHISCDGGALTGQTDWSWLLPLISWSSSSSVSEASVAAAGTVTYSAQKLHARIGDEIWCSFLSTHAFLLGNGQTYATLGVPYYRFSRIFMSRNFHPCKLVPQIHVSHFQHPRNSVTSWLYARSLP